MRLPSVCSVRASFPYVPTGGDPHRQSASSTRLGRTDFSTQTSRLVGAGKSKPFA